MRIGIVLPVEGDGATAAAIVAVAREAERLNAHSLWVTDRILMPSGPQTDYPYSEVRGAVAFDPARRWIEPLAALGMVTAVTERIHLGTNVLVLPYRQPIVLAQEVASLDWLSSGRILLGVGTGWMGEEFAALGVPKAERGKRTDEYIGVLRALWASREPVTFHGRFVSFTGMTLPASPRRVGGPPILIGGTSHAALHRVARLGDGWLGVDLAPEATRSVVSHILELCNLEGRPSVDLILSMRRRLEPANGLPYGTTAQQLVAEVGLYASAGINLMVFDLLMIPDILGAMRWLFLEVVPQLGNMKASR
jgi:probable F420-dependent oxidoreductase